MHIKVCKGLCGRTGRQIHLLQLQHQPEASGGYGDQARGDLETGSAVARRASGGGAGATTGGRAESGLNGGGAAGGICSGSCGYCCRLGAIGGGRAVDRRVVAVQLALLLGGADAGVVGAVGVAGQQVDVLRAETGVVVLGAGVDLALDGGNADVESAADALARRERCVLSSTYVSAAQVPPAAAAAEVEVAKVEEV